jgi:hypothetical protein
MSRISSGVKLTAATLATAMLVGLSTPSQAASGSVRLVVTKAGFIIGAGGGHGTLNFQGRSYRLSVGGLSIGTIGVATADLRGTAFNLNSAADIAGTYAAVSASAAFAAGAKFVDLKNEKGVVLRLRGPQVGFEASMNLSGLTLAVQ